MSNAVAFSISNDVSLDQDKHFTAVRFARPLTKSELKELARVTPTFIQRGGEVEIIILQGRWYHRMILDIFLGKEIQSCKNVLGADSKELPFKPTHENRIYPHLLYKGANQK